MQRYDQRSLTLDAHLKIRSFERLRQIDVNDIRVCAGYTPGGEVDSCSDEFYFQPGDPFELRQLLRRNVQLAIIGEDGRDREETIGPGALVELEAGDGCMIVPPGFDEFAIEAVDHTMIACYIQLVDEGTANETAFAAGSSEIEGSTFGGSGLPYFIGHAAVEVFTIPAVADEVPEFTGECEGRCLSRHI